MTPTYQIMRPIDRMVGEMLETWNKRYAFTVDRAAGKAEFSLAEIKISAEEIEGEMIRISVILDGKLFTKVGGPSDCAREIEMIMFPEGEGTPTRIRRQTPSKPWWRFWR